jgi:hypothetical protein
MLAVCGLLQMVGVPSVRRIIPLHSPELPVFFVVLSHYLPHFFTVLQPLLVQAIHIVGSLFIFFLSVISSLSVLYTQGTFFKPSIIFVLSVPSLVWVVHESIILLVSPCKQNRKRFDVRTAFM